MKPFLAIIFFVFLEGCSEDSWRNEKIGETGVSFEVPITFLVTTEIKELQGNSKFYDVKATSENGDRIRITVLSLAETPDLPERSQSFKCPYLPSQDVQETSRKEVVAGFSETVKTCTTKEREIALMIFVRGNNLITVSISSAELGNKSLSSSLLNRVGYKN